MKRFILIILALVLFKSAQSQDDFKKFIVNGADTVFILVDEPARPVDGMASFYKEISQLMRYPAFARKNKIEGRVFLEFVVNQDGTLSDIGIVRGVEKSLDEEAMRVLRIVRNWIPGKLAGRVVKSKFNIAIIFKLN